MKRLIIVLLVCLLKVSAFCMFTSLEENSRILQEALAEAVALDDPCCRFDSDDEIVNMHYETNEDVIRLKTQLRAQREALLAPTIFNFSLVRKFIFVGTCSMCSVLWYWFKMNIVKVKNPFSIVVFPSHIMSKFVSVVYIPKNYDNNNLLVSVQKSNYDKFLGSVWRSKNCIMTKSYDCLLF
jgi:hypothetical protein